MQLKGAFDSPAAIELDSHGRLSRICTTVGLKVVKIELHEIASVQHVTSDMRTSKASVIGGATIGAVLAGPIGAIIGAWMSSGKSSQQVAIITLVDGRITVAQTSVVELGQLLECQGRAQSARDKRSAAERQTNDFLASISAPKPSRPNNPFAFLDNIAD